MQKKINLYSVVSMISFYIMLSIILFFKWYNDSNPQVAILISTFLLSALSIGSLKIEKGYSYIYILITIFILYIIINILFTAQHEYLFESLFMHTLLPLLCVVYFILLNKNKTSFVKKRILNPLFYILNLYYIINFFIILKQINTPGFMIRNFSNNTFYLDQIDGLLGTNGTARLMFLNIICLFINYIFFKTENKRKRIFSKIMFIFILITSCYVSIFNDSRMYYFILILYLFPLFANKIKNIKNILNPKRIIYVLIISTVFLLIYNFNEKVHRLVYNGIIESYFIRTFEGIKKEDDKSHKEERIYLLEIAMNNKKGYGIGTGIGSINSNGEEINKHFGLNDCNVRIYTGGVIYLILIILLYSSGYQIIMSTNKHSSFIYTFICLLIISFYTQIFTYTDKSLLISMIYFLNKKRGDSIE